MSPGPCEACLMQQRYSARFPRCKSLAAREQTLHAGAVSYIRARAGCGRPQPCRAPCLAVGSAPAILRLCPSPRRSRARTVGGRRPGSSPPPSPASSASRICRLAAASQIDARRLRAPAAAWRAARPRCRFRPTAQPCARFLRKLPTAAGRGGEKGARGLAHGPLGGRQLGRLERAGRRIGDGGAELLHLEHGEPALAQAVLVEAHDAVDAGKSLRPREVRRRVTGAGRVRGQADRQADRVVGDARDPRRRVAERLGEALREGCARRSDRGSGTSRRRRRRRARSRGSPRRLSPKASPCWCRALSRR